MRPGWGTTMTTRPTDMEPVGWLCPRCGSSNAPSVEQCRCRRAQDAGPVSPGNVADVAWDLAAPLFASGAPLSPAVGLRSRTRRSGPTRTRQTVMYLLRDVLGWSYAEIGEAVGRDHGTVMHAERMVFNWLETEPGFAHRFSAVRTAFMQCIAEVGDPAPR